MSSRTTQKHTEISNGGEKNSEPQESGDRIECENPADMDIYIKDLTFTERYLKI
jgi:hypothetical protein